MCFHIGLRKLDCGARPPATQFCLCNFGQVTQCFLPQFAHLCNGDIYSAYFKDLCLDYIK